MLMGQTPVQRAKTEKLMSVNSAECIGGNCTPLRYGRNRLSFSAIALFFAKEQQNCHSTGTTTKMLYTCLMPTLTLDDLRAKLLAWPEKPAGLSPNAVLGEGNPQAAVMFIGEAPGEQEDKQGRPFVGPAGKLLDELLGTIGLQRSDVYISNVVKFRPPNNRDPTDEEKAACMPWLQLEISMIRPAVIVPLGRHALGHFFQKGSISAMHGTAQKLTNNLTVFPIYHPAAALHNPGLRQALHDDFAALGACLRERGLL